MIKFKGYAITMDGEYPIVNKLSKKTKGENIGEEVLVPTYYPRDIEGAFLILHRITTTDASRECKTLKDVIKAIDDNHKELIEVLREANV